MANILVTIAPILMIGLVVILLLGLRNLMSGGSPNLSQKLMRARVLVQFVALIVMMTALYLSQT